MKQLPFTLALTLAGLPGGAPLALAVPATADLTLVEEAGFNQIELLLELEPLLPNATDTTTLSGSFGVALEIDPATDQVSELSVTSGAITGSGVDLSGSRFLAGSYDFTSTELGAELSTPEPPGVVDPITGEFDAAQHAFSINSGNLGGTVAIPLLGIAETINFDFAAEPIAGVGSEIGMVSLVETASTPTSKTYDVTVTLPLAIAESFDAGGFMIPVSAEGTIKAVGSTTVPIAPADPYLAWTEENGMAGALFTDDANGDGVPNGLHWALGLDPATSPLPFLLQPGGDQAATIDFTFTLPPGGSAAAITVLVSDDPESTPFAILSPGAVSAGNPIPAGTNGVVTIHLPKNGMGFVRLAADAP